jgi:ribose-phosphate pyrophosphokinase
MNIPSAIIPGPGAESIAVNVLKSMFAETFLKGTYSNLPSFINMKMEHYSDHEFAPMISQTVRDKRVFLMQHVHGSGERLQQLLFTINAAKGCSAEKVVAIIPYYPFCRQDKTMNKRTSLGAKLIAKQLEAAGADAVICFDPHATQIQGFFDIPVDMIGGLMIFKSYLDELFQGMDLNKITFASPDEGGTKRTKKFKEAYPGTNMVMIDKSRVQANEIASMELIGNVEGQDVVLVDDIADTSGTICKAANLLMEKGAKSVRAVITHAVLSGNAYENINNSALQELIVSDTIPIDLTKSEKIRVATIAPALAQVMLRLTNSQSISEINR